jgi:predicted small secreted protein
MTKRMLQHYGEITANMVRQKAMTYLGTNTRDEQDSNIMYNCLCKSVRDTIIAKVSKEVSKYRYMVNGEYIFYGPPYLLTIIELTYINTKANITTVRDNLQSLSEYMDLIVDSKENLADLLTQPLGAVTNFSWSYANVYLP